MTTALLFVSFFNMLTFYKTKTRYNCRLIQRLQKLKYNIYVVKGCYESSDQEWTYLSVDLTSNSKCHETKSYHHYYHLMK